MRKHSQLAKGFYNSKAWRQCRAGYIATVHGQLCEMRCGELGYIVDHIEEINIDNINDPYVTLNHDNLQYLCTSCHNKKTFKKYEETREDVKFDANGDLVFIGE